MIDTISALPDRPVYRAASAYEKVYPYTGAVGSALFTPGNRVDRFNAGTESLGYGLGYQTAARLYAKGLKKLYESHPALAEQVNRHPILVGGPAALVGIVLASAAGRASRQAVSSLLQNGNLQQGVRRSLYSGMGDKLANTLMPLGRFAAQRWVQLGAVASLGAFGLTLVFRMLQDGSAFGKAYRQAREATPDVSKTSPYALKNQVALQRGFQQFYPKTLPAQQSAPAGSAPQMQQAQQPVTLANT